MVTADRFRFDSQIGSVAVGAFSTGHPLRVLLQTDADPEHRTAAYSEWSDDVGRARITVGDAIVSVEDQWCVPDDGEEGTVEVHRLVRVAGNAPGGFASELRLGAPGLFAHAELFLPGTQYGDPRRSHPLAIGGRHARDFGARFGFIREDRMPAPLVGIRLPDGSTVAVLDVRPDGRTSAADAADVDAVTIVDTDVRLGSLSFGEADGGAYVGYAFPAVEGPTTYRGDTFPDGQLRAWRQRFHPLTDGLEQEYTLRFRVRSDEDLAGFMRDAWRWAWAVLQPRLERQDIPAARHALFGQLADSALMVNGRAGFPHFRDAVTGRPYDPPHRQADHALMGFTGRSTDCAYYLLREAARVDDPERAAHYRSVARAVLDSFADVLPVDPPAGEGFDIRTGAVVPAAPHQARDDVMLLRGLAEGAKSMLRTWRLPGGAADPAWLSWGLRLTDWLMAQQQADGSVPRAWVLGTAEVADSSPFSTYNAVSVLVEAYRATSENRYLAAAIAAGEFSWRSGQDRGVFVGGTLDNPDVIDKEAGTLSLEAYLALYEATSEPEWLTRARAAADYAETWIYIWNVPMPAAPEHGQGWKPGVTTIGAQLIASGHSLTDQYMAFDVGSYAKLAVYADDAHYLEVAQVLLHNTKVMLSTPQHPYDLAGPGWQQEHWSFAPPRGEGLHRGWLPWVTCSHIEGIVALEDFDAALLAALS